MTRGGYTPLECRAMYMDEVESLFLYWRRVPPLRDIVAAFVGVTDQPRRTSIAQLPPPLPEFEE